VWLDEQVEQGSARMHIDSAGRQYITVGGERRGYTCYLLRRSFRDEQGRPRKETLANLSALPDEAISALRKVLKGCHAGRCGGGFPDRTLGTPR
jgi:hypothetical protein